MKTKTAVLTRTGIGRIALGLGLVLGTILLAPSEALARTWNLGTVSGSRPLSGTFVEDDLGGFYGISTRYIHNYSFSVSQSGTAYIKDFAASITSGNGTVNVNVVTTQDERMLYNVGTGSFNVRPGYTYTVQVYTYLNKSQSYSLTLQTPGNNPPPPVGKPDLAPYTPSGWSGPLVVTTSSSSTTSGSTFKDTDSIYVHFAVLCSGASISGTFSNSLYVDGVLENTWTSSSLQEGYYTHDSSAYSLGKLSAGSHTLKLVADSGNDVSESNEGNNTYSKTITVSATVKSFKVSFNAGGGSGSKASVSVTGGTYYTLPSCPFSRTGYVFAGWNATSCCSAFKNPLAAGDRILVSEDVVLTATWTAYPSNDNFAKAVVISGTSGAVSASNVNATKENGEPLVSKWTSATTTIWWKWTAPDSGTAQFSTVGTSFDTVMGVYSGSYLSSLKVEDQNDDYGGARTSFCTIACTRGTAYYIAVAGYGGKSGAVSLCWSFTAAPKDYAISYQLNGGTRASGTPTSAMPGEWLVLPSPVRSGYVFGGWQAVSGLDTTCAVVSTDGLVAYQWWPSSAVVGAGLDAFVISNLARGGETVTLKALWVENKYNLVYQLNGGTAYPGTPTSARIGEWLVLPSPTKAGYVFGGWQAVSGLDTTCAVLSVDGVTAFQWWPFEAVVGAGIDAFVISDLGRAGGTVTLKALWMR